MVIIGVGNQDRGDDAAGLCVAQGVESRIRDHRAAGRVAVLARSGEATALLDAFADARAVIIADAVHSGAAPGTVHRLDAVAESVPDSFLRCSTHSFGVADAIELARALGQLPAYLVVYGIEVSQVGHGRPLSKPVAQAVPVVVERILADMDRVLAGNMESSD